MTSTQLFVSVFLAAQCIATFSRAFHRFMIHQIMEEKWKNERVAGRCIWPASLECRSPVYVSVWLATSWRWTDLRRGPTPRAARSQQLCAPSRLPPAASSSPRSRRRVPWHGALTTRTAPSPRSPSAAPPPPPAATTRHRTCSTTTLRFKLSDYISTL